MAQSSEIKLNKRFDQNIEITGTLTVGGSEIDFSSFLTSFTETDPVFNASAAAGITTTNITNWDTAYGWGNHADAGYLTSLNATLSRFSENNWAGGGSYPGYTFSGGNTRFGLSSTAGVVDLYIDGNFYATDSSHLVIHAGNIGSQSVNYASSAGYASNADAVDGYHETSFFRSDLGQIGNSDLAFGETTGFPNTPRSGVYKVDHVGYSSQLAVFNGSGSANTVALQTHYNGDMYVHVNIDGNQWQSDRIWTSQNFDPNSKASASHNHDDRYYTETESDAKYQVQSDNIIQYRGQITSQDWNTYIDGTEAGWFRANGISGSNKPPAYTYGLALSASYNGQAKMQWYFPETGSSSNGIYVRTGWNTAYRDWRSVALHGVNPQTSGYLYATRFYDSDNTGYYADPNSDSYFKGLFIGDNAGSNQKIDIRYGNGTSGYGAIRFHQAGSNNQTIHAFSTSWQGGLFPSQSAGAINITGANGVTFGGWNNPDAWINNAGNISARDSMSSPIYYDRNNTSYYVNPDGSSLMKQQRLDTATSGWTEMYGYNDTSRVHNDNLRHGLVINSDYYPHIDVNAVNSGEVNATHGAVISMTGKLGSGFRRWGMGIAQYNPNELSFGYADNQTNPHYGVGINWASSAKMWIDTGGHLYSTGSMRSPIFYDSNDTNYFLDPNGTSILNDIRFNIDSRASSDISSLVRFNGNYTDGRWAHRFRKQDLGGGVPLFIDFSTTSANSYSALARFGAYTGNGYEFQVFGDAKVDGQLHTPIFYDSNNTSYYCDPASTSNFEALTLQGQPQNNPQHNRFFNATTYSWLSPTMYYRYTKVARLSNSTSRATFKYYCKKDANYPGAVHGVVNVATYASASMSVQHDQLGGDGQMTPEVYIDNNRDIWIRMSGSAWSSHVTWHWIYNSGVTVYDGSTQSNTDPGNGLYRIQPGESFRFTWGNTSGPTHYQQTNVVQRLSARHSIYSPIYYDSDNTGYYVDAASTTNLNTVLMNAQTWRGNITWNSGININVSGESSFDILGSGGIWQVWTAANSQPSIYVTYAGQTEIGLAGNRGLKVHGAMTATGDVVAYSDERVKENIKTIDNALDEVNALRGVEFNKIGDTKKSIGVIAQEIEKVLPEVVREEDDGMKAVAYGNIVGVLIEAVKELSNKVEELENKLNGTEL